MIQAVCRNHSDIGTAGWRAASYSKRAGVSSPAAGWSQNKVSSSHKLAGTARSLPAFLQAGFLIQPIKERSMGFVAQILGQEIEKHLPLLATPATYLLAYAVWDSQPPSEED